MDQNCSKPIYVVKTPICLPSPSHGRIPATWPVMVDETLVSKMDSRWFEMTYKNLWTPISQPFKAWPSLEINWVHQSEKTFQSYPQVVFVSWILEWPTNKVGPSHLIHVQPLAGRISMGLLTQKFRHSRSDLDHIWTSSSMDHWTLFWARRESHCSSKEVPSTSPGWLDAAINRQKNTCGNQRFSI